MKKILFALIILLFISGCSIYLQEKTELVENAPKDSSGLPALPNCVGLACMEMPEELCLGSGGKWNDCGSPCMGTTAEVCIEMCSAQCECGQNKYNCPDGFTCRVVGGFKENLGVCVQV